MTTVLTRREMHARRRQHMAQRTTVVLRSKAALKELRLLNGLSLRDMEDRLVGYCGKSFIGHLEATEGRNVKWACSERVGRRIEEVLGQPAGFLFAPKTSTVPHTSSPDRNAA